MTGLQIIATILSVCALGSYANQRLLKWPAPLALTLLGLMVAVSLQALNGFGLVDIAFVEKILHAVDFPNLLLHGLLGLMLFAGALFVDLLALKQWWKPVARLATLGVLISAAATAGMVWLASQYFSLGLSALWCLLFGALIAPTDPIAALAIVRKSGAPQHLETKLVGESLFNDGSAIVLFLALLAILQTGDISMGQLSHEVFVAPLGGAALGGLLAWMGTRAIGRVDHHPTELILTIALATGVYALAEAIHVSAPIAAVVAGLVVGHYGREHAMSEYTREHIDAFWEGADELLNAVLFAVIGLQLLVLDMSWTLLLMGVLAWFMVLMGRWAGVSGSLVGHRRNFGRAATTTILVWGGLRGGISLALALSLPQSREKDVLVAMTFVVVALSSVFQGLTLERVISRFVRPMQQREDQTGEA